MSESRIESLLTPRDAAKRLCISQRKLWGLTKSGEVVAARIGRSVRYSPADLDEFIGRCRAAT
jgi:excisionase family DNA binding protein